MQDIVCFFLINVNFQQRYVANSANIWWFLALTECWITLFLVIVVIAVCDRRFILMHVKASTTFSLKGFLPVLNITTWPFKGCYLELVINLPCLACLRLIKMFPLLWEFIFSAKRWQNKLWLWKLTAKTQSYQLQLITIATNHILMLDSLLHTKQTW